MPLKLRMYCALHRPMGKAQIGYHLAVITLSFVTGYVLIACYLQNGKRSLLLAIACIDSPLIAVLACETALQLWSSSYRAHYRGFVGKLRYLADHFAYKLVDLCGIATYLLFLCHFPWEENLGGVLSRNMLIIGHSTQVLQMYRLTRRHLRLMINALHHKFGFIFSIFLFTVSIFLMLSRSIYLLERDLNPKLGSIQDATWLVFISILCIGFSDTSPVTSEGKLFLIFVAYFGVISFAIMISLVGAQLASEKDEAKIVSLIPAVSLVQNLWILHSMETNHFWKYLDVRLRRIDKRAIVCVQKIKCMVSSRHFKVSQSDITAFDENILLYEHLLNRLDFIEKNIYHNMYTLQSLNAEISDLTNAHKYNDDDDKRASFFPPIFMSAKSKNHLIERIKSR